jgi:predicted alpha/beta hydrolase
MPTETLRFPALDGRLLAATIHSPDGPPRAVVVMFGALGVPRRFYGPFAAWLAARGIAVLSFDYRGCGESRSVPLRRDPATLLDWARLDAAAAIDLASDRWAGVPVWAIGHSFGGQAIGLCPRGLDLAGAIVVAAGSGDLELFAPRVRRSLQLQFGVMVPLVGAVVGYIPGRLGLGEDLPRGVVRQWARWAMTPDYVRGALGLDATHFHRIDAPMWFFDIGDDTYAPAGPSAALRGWYTRARKQHRVVTPGELGRASVGHFGGFRVGVGEPLWQAMLTAITGDVAVRVDVGEVRVDSRGA